MHSAILSLLATLIQQLPMPLPGPRIAIWTISRCLGVVPGVQLMRLRWRTAT